jgi:polar amino acid transport system substrate-binding protein
MTLAGHRVFFTKLFHVERKISGMGRKLWLTSATCLLLVLAGPNFAAERLRLTNGEWPPFTSEKFPSGGPLSRIVAAAFAMENISVEYGYFPWKRAYEYAKSGKWDGSVAWAPTPDHARDFYLSDPVIVIHKALFHLKSTPFDWKTIDDLRNWRVGGTAGYSYGAEWDEAVKSGRLKVEEVSLDEQNIKKLLLKRIDVVAMEIDVANYLLKSRLSAEEAALIVYHPRLVMQTPICVAFSRQALKSPVWVARFNRGLQRLRESRGYEQVLAEPAPKKRVGTTPGR